MMLFVLEKVGLCFIIGLIVVQTSVAPSARSTINKNKVLQNNSYLSDQKYTESFSYPETVTLLPNSSRLVNFSYCQRKPEFKLSSGSLFTYLMRLKLCYHVANRSWLTDHCKEQLYDFTDYHKAVYAKFCQPRKFQIECGNSALDEFSTIIHNWIVKHNLPELRKVYDPKYEDKEFYAINKSRIVTGVFNCETVQSLLETFNTKQSNQTVQSSNSYENKDFENPFYDVKFTEWFLMFRVFCDPVACGQSLHNYEKQPLSAYHCFPSTCKSAMIFIMVFDSILSLIVVVANFLVLAVAARTSIMRNVPGYFKISLAVADLMVGLFVLPGSVYHHYILNIPPLPYRIEGKEPLSTDYFHQGYLDFMGFFTVLSFSGSLYTMGAASIDRYLAITKPFQYQKRKYLTRKRSAVVFALIWSFGFILAVYPVFTSNYNVSALGLILSTGTWPLIIYATTLGLPLLAVWVINGAMLKHVRGEKGSRNSSVSKTHPMKVVQKKTACNGETKTEGTNSHLIDNENIQNFNNNKVPRKIKQKVDSNPRQNRVSQFRASVHSQIKKRFSSSSSTGLMSQAKVERKLTKTLGIMIGAFTVALLPPILVFLFQPALLRFISPVHFPKTYSPSVMNSYTTAEYFASRLFLSNSFWNCIIYSIRNRQFRQAVINVFICDEEKRRRFRQVSIPGSIPSYRRRRSSQLSNVTNMNSNNCDSQKNKIREGTVQPNCLSHKVKQVHDDVQSYYINR